MTDLGTLPGGSASFAFGINDSGQVVGEAYFVGFQAPHAFIYSNGQITDLGTLAGDNSSSARKINENGQVVGTSWISTVGGSNRGFLYSNGMMTGLGTIQGTTLNTTVANQINDNGEIVGEYASAAGPYKGFLYSDGDLVDLDTLVPIRYRGLSRGPGINNSGQIASARSFAVLLTPRTGGTNHPPVVQNQTIGLASGIMRPGTLVGTIEASDSDTGQELTYTLVSGNTLNAFGLHSATGELTVRNPLAVIRPIAFSLRVRVTDNASPPLNAEATITVNVTRAGAAAPTAPPPATVRRR